MNDFMKARWRLERLLFVSSPPDENTLGKVFTGRAAELGTIESTVVDAPRRLLVTGLFGAGKTVALRELGRRLSGNRDRVLVVEDMLYSSDRSLADVLIRGLAQALAFESNYASILSAELLGVSDERSTSSQVTDSVEGAIPDFLKSATEVQEALSRTLVFKKLPDDPIPVVRRLIDESVARQPARRLVLVIDDLDKRDPSTVRQLLVGCKGLIHDPRCSFVFTGHPIGIMRDAYSTEGGIIDRELKIPLMSKDTMRTMVARYLGAGRQKSLFALREPEFRGGTPEADDIAPFTDESLTYIVSQAKGLPRVLNIICFNVLLEGAARQYETIGIDELRECWNACAAQLRRGLHPDWRDTFELMTQREAPLDLEDIPDEVFHTLRIDRHEDLLQQLSQGMSSDLLTTTDGRFVSPIALLMPFDEAGDDEMK